MFKRFLMATLLAVAIAAPVSLMAKHNACETSATCQCSKEKNCGCDMKKENCKCDAKKEKMCDGKKTKACNEKQSCGCKGEKKAPVCEKKQQCGCKKDNNSTVVIEPVK